MGMKPTTVAFTANTIVPLRHDVLIVLESNITHRPCFSLASMAAAFAIVAAFNISFISFLNGALATDSGGTPLYSPLEEQPGPHPDMSDEHLK